jgi:hypothetical protein
MEKISAEARKRYAEKVREYRQTVERIQKRHREMEGAIHAERKSRGVPSGQYHFDSAADLESFRQINARCYQLADSYLDLLSYYNLMNSLSLSLLGVRNDGFLNEARKCCYKSLICMEEILSPYIDTPFSEYQQGVESLAELGDKAIYDFVRKMGFSIDTVVEEFGANSKWKWSFVELQGRYATTAKNLINMKTFLSQLDPRIEGYSQRLSHLQLTKKLLQQAADRYREKYELSTLRLDDIKKAILYLAALKRLHTLLGEVEEAEIVKRKMDIWKAKMEDDQKKEELAAKMARLKRPAEGER